MKIQAKWIRDHKSDKVEQKREKGIKNLEAVAAECFTYLSFKDNLTDAGATQKILQDAVINRTPAPNEEEDEEERVWTDEQQADSSRGKKRRLLLLMMMSTVTTSLQVMLLVHVVTD